MNKKNLAWEWYWKNLSNTPPVTMLTDPARYPPDPIDAFIAGYEARQLDEKQEFASAYSHGSEVQKIAAEYVKKRGTAENLAFYEENRFIDGYLFALKQLELKQS